MALCTKGKQKVYLAQRLEGMLPKLEKKRNHGKDAKNKMTEKQKRIIRGQIIPIIGCLLLFLLDGASNTSAQEQQKRVLFISSYSYAWETVPEQIQGIQEVLSDDVNLDYKFMDTKNVASKESARIFYQSLKQYLQEVPSYDALIVGDDAAFQFALTYQEELFSGIPIAFEGVNDMKAATKASKNPLITGVTESLSYQNTITLATELYPEAKEIVAVLDDTLTGESERKLFYNYDDKFPNLKFKEINVSKLSQKEIRNQLAALGSDSILLYIMCSEDADGNHYVGFDGIKLVSESADIPTFSIVSVGMGHGFLGGEIVSQKKMGKIAAKMVKRYLDGEDFSTIKMQKNSPRTYRFDEKVMEKYGISVSDLPKNHEIINHTPTFIEKNIAMIRISIIVGIILLIMLCILFVDNVHKRRLNRELENAKVSLMDAVKYDYLTGLCNRSVFINTAQEKMARGEQFALVLFDIDHFKMINDTLGHNNGDIVLRELALRVKELCDDKFSVYRLAGDEFTAIINDTDTKVIVSYLEKIQQEFRKPFLLENKEYDIHSSIGVALYPKDASNRTDLVAAADKAMYRVKNSGRNAYAFYKKEDESIVVEGMRR